MARMSPLTRAAVVGWIERIGALATLATALVLGAALAGNVALHLLHVPPSLVLVAMVDLGPVLGVFVGNIATGVNYYGTWRVLRGLDTYDVRDDVKSQLAGTPQMLSALFRFGPLLSACLAAAALVMSVLTLGPAPVLRVDPQVSNQQPSGSQGSASPTTPEPSHRLRFALRDAIAAQQCDSPGAALPEITVTLDNSASDVEASWRIARIELLTGTAQPWAAADSASGVVLAGQMDVLTLTPDARLCALAQSQPSTYHATLDVAGGDSYTISDEITPPPPAPTSQPPASQPSASQPSASQPPTSQPPAPPPPVAVLAAHPASIAQSCPIAVTPYTVTLDTTGSTVPVTWTFSAADTAPGGRVWATATPASGVIPAEATATISITPNLAVCAAGGGTTTTCHATIAPGGTTRFSALALTDTISVPIPPVVFAPVIDGPTNHSQPCTHPSGSYAITLDNSHSTVPVVWSFAAQETVRDGAAWASFSPAGGTVPPGRTQIIQVMLNPNATACTPATLTTYHAAITASGGGQHTQLGITDTITGPPRP